MANKPRRKTIMKKGGRPMKSGKRAPSGRLSQAGAATEKRDEVLSVPRIARERRLPPELHQHALDPMAGCTAGRTLLTHVPDTSDRADLWQAVNHIRGAFVTYDRSMGMNRYAQVAKILAPVSSMETSADAPAYDDRDEATKARQAVSAYMQVQGWLGMVSRCAGSECLRLCVDMPEDRVSRDLDGFIAALRVVVNGIKGK